MAWDRPDESTIAFECDTCSDVTECDIERVRATAFPGRSIPDFIACWRYLQGMGWRSFKRTGRAWTYHCIKCGAEAEMQHREHRRQEHERDRIKSRNSA